MMNGFIQFALPGCSLLAKIKSSIITGIFFFLSNGLLFIAIPATGTILSAI